MYAIVRDLKTDNLASSLLGCIAAAGLPDEGNHKGLVDNSRNTRPYRIVQNAVCSGMQSNSQILNTGQIQASDLPSLCSSRQKVHYQETATQRISNINITAIHIFSPSIL